MESIAENFKSPSWWISVVVAGVVLHIAAAYLKALLDRSVSLFSRRWSERTQVKATQRREAVARLSSDKHEQIMIGLQAIENRITGCFLMSLGIGLLAYSVAFGEWFPGLMGALMSIFGVWPLVDSLLGSALLVDSRRAK